MPSNVVHKLLNKLPKLLLRQNKVRGHSGLSFVGPDREHGPRKAAPLNDVALRPVLPELMPEDLHYEVTDGEGNPIAVTFRS